ncbi:MAG: ECF transporter S component [Ruminococcaceae bacterium]|nr:ECF transporter S component [Oscillospiraceae bacterium]
MKNTNKMSTKVIVLCAIMTALVLLLQLMGASIRFGQFSISLVLIPIVVGTATCGVWAGAWLGLVFGLAVLMSGDAAAFLAVNVPGTILTVLAKGIACGAFSGLVYKLLEKHNRYAAVIAAAVVCPLVNTGVFLLGCLLFFMETVSVWAAEAGLGADVGRYMIFFMVGANFIFEFLLNVFVSPVIVRLINIRNKQY